MPLLGIQCPSHAFARNPGHVWCLEFGPCLPVPGTVGCAAGWLGVWANMGGKKWWRGATRDVYGAWLCAWGHWLGRGVMCVDVVARLMWWANMGGETMVVGGNA